MDIASNEMELRDRISNELSKLGFPNGENDIDEVESQCWSDIEDEELLDLILYS